MYDYMLTLPLEICSIWKPKFSGTSILDPSITRIPDRDIGAHLYEAIARFLDGLGVPRGLKAVGYVHLGVGYMLRINYYLPRYKASDVERLVEGTIPQRRVLDLAPGIGDVFGSDGKEHLTKIMEDSLEY